MFELQGVFCYCQKKFIHYIKTGLAGFFHRLKKAEKSGTNGKGKKTGAEKNGKTTGKTLKNGKTAMKFTLYREHKIWFSLVIKSI